MKTGLDVLLVEDERPKREQIQAFLCDQWPDAEVRVARSVRTAIEEVRSRIPHIMLLDMSLTTFDIGANEPGGRPQAFGGKEVFRLLARFDVRVPVVVVTAYEAFTVASGAMSLQQLKNSLEREYPENFRGVVYFNPVLGTWRRELGILVTQVLRAIEEKR